MSLLCCAEQSAPHELLPCICTDWVKVLDFSLICESICDLCLAILDQNFWKATQFTHPRCLQGCGFSLILIWFVVQFPSNVWQSWIQVFGFGLHNPGICRLWILQFQCFAIWTILVLLPAGHSAWLADSLDLVDGLLADPLVSCAITSSASIQREWAAAVEYIHDAATVMDVATLMALSPGQWKTLC